MKSTDININISVPDDMDFNDPSSAANVKIILSHNDCGDKGLDEFADNFGRLIYAVVQEFGRQVNDSKEQSGEGKNDESEQSGDENEESAGCILRCD